eukprot:29483-Pelagococcus_subviridis.AAC.1
MPALVLRHGPRVVDREDDLVLPLRRLRAPEPDLIFTEIRRDVRNDLPHVQTLPRAEIPLKTRRERRLQDEPQLFREFPRQRPGERLEFPPERRRRRRPRGFDLLRREELEGVLRLDVGAAAAVEAFAVVQRRVLEHLQRHPGLLAEVGATAGDEVIVVVRAAAGPVVVVVVVVAGGAAAAARAGGFLLLGLGRLFLIRLRALLALLRDAAVLLPRVRVRALVVVVVLRVARARARRVVVAVDAQPAVDAVRGTFFFLDVRRLGAAGVGLLLRREVRQRLHLHLVDARRVGRVRAAVETARGGGGGLLLRRARERLDAAVAAVAGAFVGAVTAAAAAGVGRVRFKLVLVRDLRGRVVEQLAGPRVRPVHALADDAETFSPSFQRVAEASVRVRLLAALPRRRRRRRRRDRRRRGRRR